LTRRRALARFPNGVALIRIADREYWRDAVADLSISHSRTSVQQELWRAAARGHRSPEFERHSDSMTPMRASRPGPAWAIDCMDASECSRIGWHVRLGASLAGGRPTACGERSNTTMGSGGYAPGERGRQRQRLHRWLAEGEGIPPHNDFAFALEHFRERELATRHSRRREKSSTTHRTNADQTRSQPITPKGEKPDTRLNLYHAKLNCQTRNRTD
jgi:hypothetical protein